MSKNRIELKWGEGVCTVLMSARTGRIFYYSQWEDREALHKKYGGKCYYQSRTGYHGAGYISPSVLENDLIELGFYRTDARFQQEARWFEVSGEETVSVFAPIPCDGRAPLVVVTHPRNSRDGRPQLVLFLHASDLKETLQDFLYEGFSSKSKKISTKYFLPSHEVGVEEHETSFLLYNPEGFLGIDAFRFVCDWQPRWPQQQELEDEGTISEESLKRFHLKKVSAKGGFVHLRPAGYADRFIPKSPFKISGEIGIDGWIGDGKGLVWRRDPNPLSPGTVEVLLETSVRKFKSWFPGQKAVSEGPLLGCRAWIPIIDWECLSPWERQKLMMGKLLRENEDTDEKLFIPIPEEWKEGRGIQA